jgi:hypothetical protein
MNVFTSGIVLVGATFMYKMVNNLVDVHAEHILTPSNNRTRGNAAYRTLYSNADEETKDAVGFG